MIVDKENLLSDSQDLSQTFGSAYSSTNIVDLGVAGRDLGRSPFAVVITVDEAFTSAGSATVTFNLISNNDEDLTTSATTLYSTPAIAYTELTKGQVIVLPFPKGRMASTARYVGVTYTIGTATTTAGTCSAFLTYEW